MAKSIEGSPKTILQRNRSENPTISIYKTNLQTRKQVWYIYIIYTILQQKSVFKGIFQRLRWNSACLRCPWSIFPQKRRALKPGQVLGLGCILLAFSGSWCFWWILVFGGLGFGGSWWILGGFVGSWWLWWALVGFVGSKGCNPNWRVGKEHPGQGKCLQRLWIVYWIETDSSPWFFATNIHRLERSQPNWWVVSKRPRFMRKETCETPIALNLESWNLKPFTKNPSWNLQLGTAPETFPWNHLLGITSLETLHWNPRTVGALPNSKSDTIRPP